MASVVDDGETTSGLTAELVKAPVSTTVFSGLVSVPSTVL